MSVKQSRKRIAFGWHGGKLSHLSWLLPLLPNCHHYCEPFGGSGAVLLNRSPSPVETFNDLDSDVVNFFRVIRSDKDAFIKSIALTPFSREEFGIACDISQNISDFERARRFYIRVRQSRSALSQRAKPSWWGFAKTPTARGMSKSVSRWVTGIDGLSDVVDRLIRVQIENRDACTSFVCTTPRILYSIVIRPILLIPESQRVCMDTK